MKRVAFYLRVSTSDGQTTENQLLHLHEVARRLDWSVVAIFRDEGVSGAKGRDRRPGLDALLKAVSRREIDLVAAWSVDRLGRSLPDLVGLLGELQARGVDLFLHQQALDALGPHAVPDAGGVRGVREVDDPLQGHRGPQPCSGNEAPGPPPMQTEKVDAIRALLMSGTGIRETARRTGAGTASVQRVKRDMVGDAAHLPD